jgi:hypothetical protein
MDETRDSLKTSVKLLEMTKAQELQLARSAQAGNVAVVTGDHDTIEDILEAAEIPFRIYSGPGYATKSDPTVIFVNCKDYGSYDGASLKKYVERGGRIVTTDWALSAFMGAFPGYVVKGEEEVPDEMFRIDPANDIGARLLGAKAVKKSPKWWYESGSYTVLPAGKQGKAVMPLLVSPALEKEYGSDLVAFGLRHGKGEAVHFCSHLYAQRTDKGSEAVATDYTSLHAVLMLCGRAPVLYDPTGALDTGGKSITMKSGTGKRSEDLA